MFVLNMEEPDSSSLSRTIFDGEMHESGNAEKWKKWTPSPCHATDKFVAWLYSIATHGALYYIYLWKQQSNLG